MKVTISFELDNAITDDESFKTLLNAALGNPTRKARKPRPPMSDSEKKAFRKRMVDGQKDAAKAREKPAPKSKSKKKTKK